MSEEVKLNPFRHFFLYAKGHYAKGVVIEDLGKICTAYLQHDLHVASDRMRILLHATDTIKKKMSIDKVLSEVLEASFQFNEPFDFGKHEISGTHAVIVAALQIMRHCTVDEIEGSLGSADFAILPPLGDTSLKPSGRNYFYHNVSGGVV